MQKAKFASAGFPSLGTYESMTVYGSLYYSRLAATIFESAQVLSFYPYSGS